MPSPELNKKSDWGFTSSSTLPPFQFQPRRGRFRRISKTTSPEVGVWQIPYQIRQIRGLNHQNRKQSTLDALESLLSDFLGCGNG